MQHNKILIRQLGLQPYEPVSQAMLGGGTMVAYDLLLYAAYSR
ncbi:hypothetical protein ACLBPO_03040, partial [Klebsiella pneumoniae]